MAHIDVVELRVHGVSGTPPEELLDRAEVYRVAGDKTAGFYRPRLADERTDGTWAPLLPGSHRGPQLEGYAWGGLTSGAPSRAFWLLLLPFTLVNLAPRMRPPVPNRDQGRSDPLVWATWYLSRVLGLSLTVLLVLAAAGIGDDLIGWQCGQGSRCAQTNPQWFARFAFGVDHGGTNAHGLSDDLRLALGTVVPLLVVGLLWLISRATVNRYEQVTPRVAGMSAPTAEHGVAGEVNLDSGWMWQNTALVQRLGAVHIQAGLATALWTVAGPLEPDWRRHRSEWPAGVLGAIHRHGIGLLAALVVGYGVVVIGWPSFSRHDDQPRCHRLRRAVWVVLGLGWLVVALRLLTGRLLTGRLLGGGVRRAYLDAGGRPRGGLPGFSGTVLGLFLVQIATVVLLGIVVALARRRTVRHPSGLTAGNAPAGCHGYAAIVIATTGVFLAAVFSAGAYLFTAGWLHTGSLKPGYHDLSIVPTAFHLPEAVQLAALAYTLAVISLGVVLVFCAVWFATASVTRWHGLVDVSAIATDYRGVDTSDPLVVGRKQEILRAFFYGRVVDVVDGPLTVLVGTGAAISGVIGVVLFGEHVGHWAWAQRSGRWLSATHTATQASLQSSIPGLEVVGAYLTVLTLLLLVTLGSLAFRVPATRRSVGILWDIASFWPRTAHPLAAPCYAERTVPDLITRIGYYRHGPAPGAGVVLAGHSQGTVISAAALIQLAERAPHAPTSGPENADVLTGVSLLTFGCVLRRLYGRYFPVYFGAPAFDRLARHLGGTDARPGRWLNLWRYTDYLGGMVTAGPPARKAPPDVAQRTPAAPIWEEHLRDPAFFHPRPGDTVAPPPLRHSDFWKSPDGTFQALVRQLADQVRPSHSSSPEPPPVPSTGTARPGVDRAGSRDGSGRELAPVD